MGEGNRETRGFVLDTCAVINIMKNRAFADLIKSHVDMENSPVYLNEIVLEEAQRKGYTKKQIIAEIQNGLNTFVTIKEVSKDVHSKAVELEKECSLLHHGDSAIAAFSQDNCSTLITFDKALLKGCLISGIQAFSPNMLVSGVVAA